MNDRGNMLDILDVMDPRGYIMHREIGNFLTQTNSIFEDARWRPANNLSKHQMIITTKLPRVDLGQLNRGTLASKGARRKIEENSAIFESAATVDKRLLRHAKTPENAIEYRMIEAYDHIEAMGQRAVESVFYGNIDQNPDDFLGLSNRYNRTTSGDFSKNVISNLPLNVNLETANTGMSIWLINWHDRGMFMFYPEGTAAGLRHEVFDNDLRAEVDSNMDTRYRNTFVDLFEWNMGLAIHRWDAVARLCNIDRAVYNSPTLVGTETANNNRETNVRRLLDNMTRLYHRVNKMNGGKLCWYMNKSMKENLTVVARDLVRQGGGLTFGNYDNGEDLRYMGVPIREVDRLTDSEAQVAA